MDKGSIRSQIVSKYVANKQDKEKKNGAISQFKK